MSDKEGVASPTIVVSKEAEEQRQIAQIANHLTQATNQFHGVEQLTPAQNTSPIPAFAGELKQPEHLSTEEGLDKEPEWQDNLKGWQGKIRTGKANDFLKSKMKWLSKKNKGADVSLK
jgi:hypothetical protein